MKTGNAMERVSELVARVEVGQKKRVRSGKPAAASPVQLPLWPDVMRGVPNGFLRSALFGAIGKGPRRYLEREEMAAVETLALSYTGLRLDQGDLDVWETVLHAVRQQGLGTRCRLTSYALLKLMGKTDTGKNRETLHTRLDRLRANAVTIKTGRYTYIGGLLAWAAKDEETQEWVIEVDAQMRPLFDGDQFTQIEWAIRRALDGQPLAQWLHGFYSSHAKPYPMKVATLHKLCGSETEHVWHFREKLRKSLDAVAEASTAHGQPFSYAIGEDDLVHVERKPTRSQRRHLTRKKPVQ